MKKYIFTDEQGCEYTCIVGKNAQENWQMLSESNNQDYFFHLTSLPSCYVILKVDEKEVSISDRVLSHCARICLENTKYRYMRNVSVDYTRVSNVYKGDSVGEVMYKSRKKVGVTIV